MTDDDVASHFHPGTTVPKRLVSQLDALLDARVATIIAPAGYHKTALVRAWLAAHPELDDTVIVGIVRDGKEIENADALLEPLAAIPPGPLPIIIWIDNHDRIKSPAVLNQILDLTEANPRVRLILAGRTRPNVPLGGLALRGQLVSIGLDQLALREEEVAELMTVHGPTAPASLAELMGLFAGWPIAVELVASPTVNWSQQPMLEATISGYLQEEVLGELAREDLAFLMDLSVMPELTPASAGHLSGRPDAVAQLTRLAAAGVPLEWDAGNVIRFHPMLARHLRRELRETDPERERVQNRKAATWLHGHGLSRQAIEHAVQSDDTVLAYDLVVDLLVAHIGTGLAGVGPWFTDLARVLPPTFHLGLARTLVSSLSQPDAVGASALRTLKAQIPPDAGPNDLGRFYGVVLSVTRASNYTTAPDLVAEAVEYAQSAFEGRSTLRPLEVAAVLLEYSMYLLQMGRLELAREVLQQVIANAQIVAMGWLADFATGILALANALLGNASTAQRMAEEALISVESGGRPAWMTGFALLAMGSVALDRGETASSRAQMQRLEGLARQHLIAGLEPMRLALDSMIRVDEGDARSAVAELETYRSGFADSCTDYQRFLLSHALFTAGLALGDSGRAARELELQDSLDLPETVQLIRRTNHARLHLARGQAQDAYATLASAVQDPAVAFNNKLALQALMTYGIAASQAGHAEEGLAAFQRAGVLADRLGLGVPGARHTRTASAIRPDQVPLTPAERHVLAELARDAPLADVANALFISQNTLKTHLRRIYRKMGVGNRAQAVEQARVLGIV